MVLFIFPCRFTINYLCDPAYFHAGPPSIISCSPTYFHVSPPSIYFASIWFRFPTIVFLPILSLDQILLELESR
jgi:hypothetical protein